MFVQNDLFAPRSPVYFASVHVDMFCGRGLQHRICALTNPFSCKKKYNMLKLYV